MEGIRYNQYVLTRFWKGMQKVTQIRRDFRLLTQIGIGVRPHHLVTLFSDTRLWGWIDSKTQTARRRQMDGRLGGWMTGYPGYLLYPIMRFLKPSVVIETGVGPGGSSALILKALHDNKKGHLYSIDLPGNDSIVYPTLNKRFNTHVPPGFEVGWLVPEYLRSRWSLMIGDSKKLLPDLLRSVHSVDVFLHDSLHTDEHVRWELSQVYTHIANGGVLMADDVCPEWSIEFETFCRDLMVPAAVLSGRLGVGKRPGGTSVSAEATFAD